MRKQNLERQVHYKEYDVFPMINTNKNPQLRVGRTVKMPIEVPTCHNIILGFGVPAPPLLQFRGNVHPRRKKGMAQVLWSWQSCKRPKLKFGFLTKDFDLT